MEFIFASLATPEKGTNSNRTGLVWGSVVMDQGKVVTLKLSEAENYCASDNGRLPTEMEFEELNKYLYFTKEYGLQMIEGKPYALPRLSVHDHHWSSSQTPWDSGLAYTFAYGDFGAFGQFTRDLAEAAVLCIYDR